MYSKIDMMERECKKLEIGRDPNKTLVTLGTNGTSTALLPEVLSPRASCSSWSENLECEGPPAGADVILSSISSRYLLHHLFDHRLVFGNNHRFTLVPT
jgi:hypothetical protein